jgi:hypothetical protein
MFAGNLHVVIALEHLFVFVSESNFLVIIILHHLQKIIDLGAIRMLFLRNGFDVLNLLQWFAFVTIAFDVFLHFGHAQDLVDRCAK